MTERQPTRLRASRIVAGVALLGAAMFACDRNNAEVKQKSPESPTATRTIPTPFTVRPTETTRPTPEVLTPTATASPKSTPTVKAESVPTPSSTVNRMLRLDGRLDSVEFEGDKYLFEAPLRIEARIKMKGQDLEGNAIVSKGENDAIAFFASLTTCPERGMALVIAGGQSVCGPSVQTDVWQEVAAEFDGENVRFFTNDVKVGEKAWRASIPIEQGKLFVGKSPSGVLTQEFFGGDIDSLRIINTGTGQVIFDAQFADFKDSVTGNLGVAKGDAQLVVAD